MVEKSTLILGSLALDRIETPQEQRKNLLGGSLTHALIPAGTNVPVYPVGIVGSDFPEEGWAVLNKYSVNLDNVQEKDGPTFRWGGRYSENQNKRETLFTKLGVFAGFDPVISSQAASASVVFLANIQPSLQLRVVEQCTQQSTVIVDTMNLWIETAKTKLDDVIGRAHVFLVNDEEAEQLSGSKDLDEAGEILRNLGPETVIIKLGGMGSRIYEGRNVVNVPAVNGVNVKDTTGAGDTFGGGLAAGLVLGQSLTEAVALGTAWASICVEGFGVEATLNVDAAKIETRKAEVLGGVRTC